MKQAVPFVLASCAHGTVILNRLDFRALSATHMEFGVGTDILVHGEFDLDLISITAGLLALRRERFGDGAVALDCGANIGIYTLEWARAMQGWGTVLAFEPQERIYYALAGNLAINNHFNARAMLAAVGARNEVIDMPLPDHQQPGQFGGFDLYGKSNIGQAMDQRVPVQVMTIDSLGLPRVDFIKLDIEGMEPEALVGARATIRANNPYLLVEWHICGKAPIEAFLGVGYESVTLGMNLICGPKGDPAIERLRAIPAAAAEQAA